MNSRIHKGKSIIDLPSCYTIIDIETTGLSPKYNEIIELSALQIRNEELAATFSTLVKPTSPLDPFISTLTGITDDMLLDAPPIKIALSDFLNFIGTDILIGHNVNFDINFLYDNAENFLNIPFRNDFIDTMRLFRKLCPNSEHHRLCDLAAYYNLSYVNQHRALADCQLTLVCYQHLCHEIIEKYGTVHDFASLFKKKKLHSTSLKAADILPTESSYDEDNPIFGKVFVFTGVLEKMPRKEAMQIVVNHGGINGDSVTKKTNYLVLGNNDYCKSIVDGKSSKHKKAEKYKLEGQDIEIIPEGTFYDMIEE